MPSAITSLLLVCLVDTSDVLMEYSKLRANPLVKWLGCLTVIRSTASALTERATSGCTPRIALVFGVGVALEDTVSHHASTDRAEAVFNVATINSRTTTAG